MSEASAFVLDGAAIADDVLARVAEDARALVLSGVTPGLAVVLVGENPASRTYVASKGREARPAASTRSSTLCPSTRAKGSC